jgi:hypothetical protein
MKIVVKLLCFVLLTLGMSATASAQCRSDALGTLTPGFDTSLNVNIHVKHYGMLFLDIVENDYKTQTGKDCIRRAAQRLFYKLKATNDTTSHVETLGRSVGPHQGWLEGAMLALAFPAAMRISDYGELNNDFDIELLRARDFYYAASSSGTATPGIDPGCGLRNPDGTWAGANNCMDDHSIAASAFGWIAAYEKERGRDATAYNEATRRALDRTFSTTQSVCINANGAPMTYTNGGPCNGTISQLGSLQADTKSLNHGYQDIPYGLGLMTSVSAAVIGLEESGYIITPSSYFSNDIKTIAKGLLREGQQKAQTNGDLFKTNCVAYGRQNDASGNPTNVVVIGSTSEWCGDYSGPITSKSPLYRPKMYPLKKLYQRYNLGTPDTQVIDPQVGSYQTAFQYDQWDTSLFNTDFLNEGRLATYIWLGQYWQYLPTDSIPDARIKPRPPLTGLTRTQGWVDGINSTTGVISGWACDQFNPSNPVGIHIYANDVYVTATTANLPSESAVNTICKGGTAHRFQATLPVSTRGQVIKTYGLDATWKGFALVRSYSCSNWPYCTW